MKCPRCKNEVAKLTQAATTVVAFPSGLCDTCDAVVRASDVIPDRRADTAPKLPATGNVVRSKGTQPAGSTLIQETEQKREIRRIRGPYKKRGTVAEPREPKLCSRGCGELTHRGSCTKKPPLVVDKRGLDHMAEHVERQQPKRKPKRASDTAIVEAMRDQYRLNVVNAELALAKAQLMQEAANQILDRLQKGA